MIVKHGKLAAIDHVITDGLTVSGDGVRLPVGLVAELVEQIEKINPIETFVKEHSAFSGVGGITVLYDDTADTWIVSAGELSAYVTHDELSAALANYYTSEEIDENFYTKNDINENFYTKSEIESSYYDVDEMSAKYYDKVEVDELVNRLGGYKKVPYDDVNHCPLVDDPQTKYIYLTKPTSAASTSAKDEYEAWIWSVSSDESSAGYWECIDETSVNLDGYATEQWVEQQGYLKEQEQSDWTEEDTASASYIKNKPEVLPLNAKYGIVLNGTASGVDIGIRRSLLDAKLDVSAVSSITINPSAISAYLAEKLDISAFASYSASIIQDFREVAIELNNKVDKTAFESYSATIENEISTLSANKLDTSATNDWDITEYSGGSGVNIENHIISIESTKPIIGDDKNIAVIETTESIIVSAMKDFVDADFVASAIAAVDVTSAISAKLDITAFDSYSADVDDVLATLSADFANYYTKSYIDSAYYTQTEVDDLIKDFGGFNVVTKDAQGYPDVADPNSKFIYLTLDTSAAAASAKDVFEEWIYTNNAWKCIGEASLNLEGYATQDWVTNQHYLTQQVQADWSEVDPASASYIANKPTVYSGSAAGLVPSGTSADQDKFLRGNGTWDFVDAVTISYDSVSGELHLDFSHVNN